MADQPPAVLLPVKSFRKAKERLAPALDAAGRAALAREMATTVRAAAGDLPVAVVCDDAEVAAWARGCDAEVIWRPGRGLNGAVADGVDVLAEGGHHRVLVVHADLPLADDLGRVAGDEGVTLVPDRHRDGTNVISVPSQAGFEFSYGPGSYGRHRAAVERLGLPLRILDDRRLGWDVDVPADLGFPEDLVAGARP